MKKQESDLHKLVSKMIQSGLSDRAIGKRLGMSKTVAEYHRRIYNAGGIVGTRGSTGNNVLPKYKQEQVREYVKLGMSSRQISRLIECHKKTALRWMLEFRDEAPQCRHSLNIYLCHSCCNSRRSLSPQGKIICENGPFRNVYTSERQKL